ncbi:MAG: hypothetical protein V4686_00405 [Patescibacteria group bacterium]
MKINQHKSNQKGFLEVLVIILIALILLRFLGIDIDAILAKEGVQSFFAYVKDMLVLVWGDFMKIINAFK